MSTTSPAPTPIPMQRTAISLIAEFMGWSLAPEIGADWVRTPTGDELLPTSELQDAWRIVERMRGDGWLYSLDCYSNGQHICQFFRGAGPLNLNIGIDHSPAAAICAAAAAALASAGAAAGRAKDGGQQT